MTQQHPESSYISAFLRDALRIEASPWIVTNVMGIWRAHGVGDSLLLAALDEVVAEHPLDSAPITAYRDAVSAMLARGGAMPTQRSGEAETHDVTIHCQACGDLMLLDNDDEVLVGRLAYFTADHASCPTFAVETHLRLP